MSDRISQDRVMWVIVFFDLPTETKKDVKEAQTFRKRLISDGFIMFTYSGRYPFSIPVIPVHFFVSKDRYLLRS